MMETHAEISEEKHNTEKAFKSEKYVDRELSPLLLEGALLTEIHENCVS